MIYYLEDDLNIRNLAIYALEKDGLAVTGFATAASMLAVCFDHVPELFLLDIMLPDMDGIEVLGRLRADERTAAVPVMMITAKGAEYDVVTGLDAGADDYMAKPFGMMELVSRVKALLRRLGAATTGAKRAVDAGQEVAAGDDMVCGEVRLSPGRRRVEACGKPVLLTMKEFDLLACLLRNRELVLTREQLLNDVWGFDHSGNSRTVDVHVQTLRHKLGAAGNVVQTVRGVGYRVAER